MSQESIARLESSQIILVIMIVGLRLNYPLNYNVSVVMSSS